MEIALNSGTYFSCSDAKVLKFQKSYKYLGNPMWFLSQTWNSIALAFALQVYIYWLYLYISTSISLSIYICTDIHKQCALPVSYHHKGFVATHALGHLMYGLYDIFSLISYMISFVNIVIWYPFVGALESINFQTRNSEPRFKWCNMIAKAAVKIFNKKFFRYLTHCFVWSDKANQCHLNCPIFFTLHM